jgi:soluble lytic murein transglycosylase
MRGDAGADVGALYRLTRRLDEEDRTALAARAAATLAGVIGHRANTMPDDLWRVAYPLAYGDLVADASDEQDVSPLLLLALVRQESFYDPLAGSSAGALGLTQVIEPTGIAIADDLGVVDFTLTDLFRPRLSLRFGASYIADQLDAFDGNEYHALAAYNGGPGTAADAIDAAGDDVDLFVEALEFDETRLYVKLVMENYARYRQLYGGVDRPSLPQ